MRDSHLSFLNLWSHHKLWEIIVWLKGFAQVRSITDTTLTTLPLMLVVEGFNTQAVSLHLEILIQRMHSYSHKCFYFWAVQTSNTAEKNFTCDKFKINFSFNRANKMGNFLRDIHLPHTGSILWSTPPLASGLHPLLLHYINRCSIFTTIFSHVNRNFY